MSQLSIAKQKMLLCRLFPGKSSGSQSSLTWTGPVWPSPLSVTYDVQIKYTLGKAPKVFVLSPELIEANPKIPHRYDDGSLCLYFGKDWNAGKYIALTILPWATEWLRHYEFWQLTGTWNGGGTH